MGEGIGSILPDGWIKLTMCLCFFIGKRENEGDSVKKSFGRGQISGENNSAGEVGTVASIVRI